jgi:hypothetical protein
VAKPKYISFIHFNASRKKLLCYFKQINQFTESIFFVHLDRAGELRAGETQFKDRRNELASKVRSEQRSRGEMRLDQCQVVQVLAPATDLVDPFWTDRPVDPGFEETAVVPVER